MLAIDGGNSKTDVALVAGDGTLLASARGPGINAHEVGVELIAEFDAEALVDHHRVHLRFSIFQIR